jgi:aldose 1-epimerase
VTGIRAFGAVDGAPVQEITLRSPDGVTARIITWGAVLRDLVVPTRKGPRHVVLGYDSIEAYVAHSPYFGAIVGRHANRIGQARFTLDGDRHDLSRNEGVHHLHGGETGFGQRVWRVLSHDDASCTLALDSADGDMGYPGALKATCRYTLRAPATLRIEMEATADRPTPVNLTTHSYYNLAGAPDILDHHLTVDADEFTVTDDDLIPTGEIRPTRGTHLDFRKDPTLRAALSVAQGALIDDNLVIAGEAGALRRAARLTAPARDLAMEVWTTEPGVQVYDGHLVDSPVPGLHGWRYGRHAGLCLEPQRFPDGPNQPHFPPCILRPGAVSRQVAEIRFTAGRGAEP